MTTPETDPEEAIQTGHVNADRPLVTPGDRSRAEVIQSLVAVESAVRTLREARERLWSPSAPGRL